MTLSKKKNNQWNSKSFDSMWLKYQLVCISSTINLSNFYSTLIPSLLNSHFRRIYVSLIRCFIVLQLSTTIMNLLLFTSRQLARHGPAVVVTPVLMPEYISDLSWTSWWVFSHTTVLNCIILSDLSSG